MGYEKLGHSSETIVKVKGTRRYEIEGTHHRYFLFWDIIDGFVPIETSIYEYIY